jgi:uncharacterized membrane protein (UPF0136 family)
MPAAMQSRPFLVWFIVVIQILSLLGATLVVYLIASHWDSLSDAEKMPIRALPAVSWIAGAVIGVLSTVATIQLFRMKRGALNLFLAVTAVSLLEMTHSYLAQTLSPDPWTDVIVTVCNLLTCWYVRCLYVKKMLD